MENVTVDIDGEGVVSKLNFRPERRILQFDVRRQLE